MSAGFLGRECRLFVPLPDLNFSGALVREDLTRDTSPSVAILFHMG